MRSSSNGINRVSHNAHRPVAGVGFVIISAEQNIAEYIQGCYRNNRVTIVTDRGEVLKNCFVNVDVWQTLQFPSNKKQRGSQVTWVNIPYQNRVVVVAVLSTKDQLQPVQAQHTFNFSRNFGGNNVSIVGNGATGTLLMTVQGENEDEGHVTYRLLSKKELALFDLMVQGKIAIEVEQRLDLRAGQALSFVVRDDANPGKSATISYNLGEGFTFSDEHGNQVTSRSSGLDAKVPANKVIQLEGDGNKVEKSLLGETTQDTITDIYNLLNNIVQVLRSASSSGANVKAPPVLTASATWQIKLTVLQKKIKTILSKNVKNS